jgi:manganese/zinc/iron transport system permease protein
MIDVSITTVGAFDAVGSILVVALMIAPATTAYLLTDDLKKMIILSVLIGIVSSVLGFLAAWALDSSAAGAMASMCGVSFLLAFLFAPRQGLVSQTRMKQTQKLEFAVTMLTIHLSHHQSEKQCDLECHEQHLTEHINWDKHFASQVVKKAIGEGLIKSVQGLLGLTAIGEQHVQAAMMR